MLLCRCSLPRLGSLCKTSPFLEMMRPWKPRPGPDLAGTHLAGGSEVPGDRVPCKGRLPEATPAHLPYSRPPAGVRLGHREKTGLGGNGRLVGRLSPRSLLPRGLQGEPGSTGGQWFTFPFFLPFFCPLGCPQPESQDHPNWTGSREGGVVARSVPDSTGNQLFSKTAPTRAS
nr:translation initiation factor IF-2-like [Chlorocebus sabaeus]